MIIIVRCAWSVAMLMGMLAGVSACSASDSTIGYVTPTDYDQLTARLKELHAEYAPYLRSLPPNAPERPRVSLNGDWRFEFEVKDPPKRLTPVPPAPAWFGERFDDSAWETTTVPEWRYRTVGHDNAYNLTSKAVTKLSGAGRNTSQICWYRRSFTAKKPAGDQRLWLCFDGVDWEAQVYLNGELIGDHRAYYEPFRFDVTDRIKDGQITLAVRVIDGVAYGEPVWGWSVFPDIRAKRQRYTPNPDDSIQGNVPIGYHGGTGFGIWRDVYLQTTGPVRIDDVLARHDLSDGHVRVKVELDSAAARQTKLRVHIMPENCHGAAYEGSVDVLLPAGASVQELTIPMPDAKAWSPEAPNLYRCRVTVANDVKDALFGCRSFTLVNRSYRPPTYTFKPTHAKWLRIVGRGSNQSEWNSIWEVDAKTLLRDPKTVTASGHYQGFTAAMAIDGRSDTRWAVQGGGWIQFQLDPTIALSEVGIGWYEANVRQWDFDIMVSDDGQMWTKLEYQRAKVELLDTLSNGMLMLNGKPCYLRGTNVHGFNAYAYWNQTDKLIDAALMLKAGHFNAVRVCQHVQMPEVRQMLDRLGMMSEQDLGAGGYGGYPTGDRAPQYVHAAKVLTHITYNNPGVVLVSLGNEGDWPTADAVRAGLSVDPQRIYVPISGRFTHSSKVWDMPQDLRANAIDDGHPYNGWYGGIRAQTWSYPSPVSSNVGGAERMITLGEFGAEALDSYETMKNYPPQFAPPPKDADTLWAAAQVATRDVRQLIGLGRDPKNLGEYIEASQNYQEALLADCMIQMRLLPRAIAGYFQFHFMDVIPAFWPKSIVGHDHRPKTAYYQIAQINQPVVVLPRLAGNRPEAMTLWVCNDLERSFDNAIITWTVSREGQTLIQGRKQIDVAPLNATQVQTIDLKPVTWKYDECDLHFTLADADGKVISQYQRQLRCVPTSLLKKDIREQVEDPFKQSPARLD